MLAEGTGEVPGDPVRGSTTMSGRSCFMLYIIRGPEGSPEFALTASGATAGQHAAADTRPASRSWRPGSGSCLHSRGLLVAATGLPDRRQLQATRLILDARGWRGAAGRALAVRAALDLRLVNIIHCAI